MILDRLENAARYEILHPLFARAFDWLRENQTAAFEPASRIEIDGQKLFAIVDQRTARGQADSPLEIHRRYIDIQFGVSGTDSIGWLPTRHCRAPQAEFDTQRDIQFFNDQPELYLTINPGAFAIFFPEDAHAPLAAPAGGAIHKLIIKIEVQDF